MKAIKNSIFGLFALTLFVSGALFAQSEKSTIISVRPISLLYSQPNLKVEKAFGSSLSAGAEVSYFTRSHSGLKAEPFLRFFTGRKGNAPDGFYFQTKLLVGNHKQELSQLEDEFGIPGDGKERFSAMGAGIGVGRQWLRGKDGNIAIDLYSGIKRYRPIGTTDTGETIAFTGRSFPLELRLNVGIAF